MADTSALRSPAFWLRISQVVFGIIAFATIAEGSGFSRVNYAIFCGVLTMIISLALAGCLLAGVVAVKGLPSLIYDSLFFIFWLACAAALSDTLAGLSGWGVSDGRLEASVAFSWLTWFAFIASIIVDILDLRSGAGARASGGAAAPVEGSKGAPTGAAAMPVVAAV